VKRPFLTVRRHTHPRLGVGYVWWQVRCRICGHKVRARVWRVALGLAHVHVLRGCVSPRDHTVVSEPCG
jgi:hypothetical protein